MLCCSCCCCWARDPSPLGCWCWAGELLPLTWYLARALVLTPALSILWGAVGMRELRFFGGVLVVLALWFEQGVVVRNGCGRLCEGEVWEWGAALSGDSCSSFARMRCRAAFCWGVARVGSG